MAPKWVFKEVSTNSLIPMKVIFLTPIPGGKKKTIFDEEQRNWLVKMFRMFIIFLDFTFSSPFLFLSLSVFYFPSWTHIFRGFSTASHALNYPLRAPSPQRLLPLTSQDSLRTLQAQFQIGSYLISLSAPVDLIRLCRTLLVHF